MSSQEDGAAEPGPETVEPSNSSNDNDATTGDIISVTIGATVPTGFEHTAAEEVKEKIGVDARISKDRGRIYFPITTDKLFQVRNMKLTHALFFQGVSSLTSIQIIKLEMSLSDCLFVLFIDFLTVGTSSEVCGQPVCCG